MEAIGRDERLIFIHGSGDSGVIWAPLLALLPDVETLAFDLPGHGERLAEPGPERMSVRDYAEDVYQSLTARGMDGGVVIGHSLGGAITLRLAVDHPAFARRIVLVGSGARLRVAPRFLEEARAAGPEGSLLLTEMEFEQGHEDQARALYTARPQTAPGMLYRDLVACDAFDMMSELDAITQPALLIVGEADRMTPVKYAEFLRQRLPQSELVVIPDAGHYVQIERPEAVAAALRAWLAMGSAPA
ncbi:MAG TPA: alpha/beta hydrolase [Ktedonobacterales bacterium]|nr:alpha/beta hydrolase [Ktedonobacterales bacterium]